MSKRFVFALLFMASAIAHAQRSPNSYFDATKAIATAPLTFPGPDGGFTFVHLPVNEVKEWGDTIVTPHAFLIDVNLSHEGEYLSPDTVLNVKSNTPFEFLFPNKHIIHAQLTPTHAHEEYNNFDTTYDGMIGYGLIKQFITVFDFQKKTLTFYPLYTHFEVKKSDSDAIELPLIDDAKITYCGCVFPTIWLEGDAPPFKRGHVHLGFEQPLSQIYAPALDKRTSAILDQQYVKDSLAGTKRPLGLNLAGFKLRTLYGTSENLARRSPHRAIADLPPQYHDLNVPLLGSVGTDFLRTFSGMIIDPSRQMIVLLK